MPGKKEYQLSLGEKFSGGRKHWETFNGTIVNKMMDQGLAIFVDIAACLHTYMQTSLTECQMDAPADSEPATPGLTPSSRRRLAREMRTLGVAAADGPSESGGPANADATGKPTINSPLLPEHLT
eukprot:CAMPEP_0181338122 /NCGR_PEP_ID=MMETSP1101-20121128/28458_1 /TAXON_ID=46948 /ORGANISM="Rhodomonas abbreviata, Strain Caron Lab Isolate" /LENGTH=124 /DNA_ID=CAMNT_0023448811 /DNA_START=90 /DNA_END=460 /DNA_ORIENTATION=+